MEQLIWLIRQEYGFLWIYLIIINVLTFLAFALDKVKAKTNRWRTKEKTLLTLSFIGGSLGGLLGMYICHHKIRKPRFSIGVPLMLVLHLGLLIWFLR